MKFNELLARFSNHRFFWGAVCAFIVGALVCFHWQKKLEETVSSFKEEYAIDQELSKHKAEHLEVYQGIVGAGGLPESEALASNAWIQQTQQAVSDQKLSLQELKPSSAQRKKGAKKPGLFLVVEGTGPDLANFVYRIGKANDLVYVDRANFSRSSEEAELVRAQMTLAQIEGR